MQIVRIKRGIPPVNTPKKIHVIKDEATITLCGEKLKGTDKFELVVGEIDCSRCKDRHDKAIARTYRNAPNFNDPAVQQQLQANQSI